MTLRFGPDQWCAGLMQLVQQVDPAMRSTTIYAQLGIGALYVMSEEWWDPSIIELHPRMPVGFVPALHQLRQLQLQRLTSLGVDVHMYWYRVNDAALWHTISKAVADGCTVGLFGITGVSFVSVQVIVGTIVTGNDSLGGFITIDLQQVRAPAGVECVIATPATATNRQTGDALGWLVQLLDGFPTIAFDTPRHPLRDWQVWHIGVDAFAVAALSAESAAPLAIVSDNVARIIHAYMWRIDLLQQQLVHLNQSRQSSLLNEAIEGCRDAHFFLNIVAQHYPLTVERRALSIPEGALIAETCRDTRQVLRDVANLLRGVS